jgi:hypothetical protein
LRSVTHPDGGYDTVTSDRAVRSDGESHHRGSLCPSFPGAALRRAREPTEGTGKARFPPFRGFGNQRDPLPAAVYIAEVEHAALVPAADAGPGGTRASARLPSRRRRRRRGAVLAARPAAGSGLDEPKRSAPYCYVLAFLQRRRKVRDSLSLRVSKTECDARFEPERAPLVRDSIR